LDNFLKVADAVDTLPILAALKSRPDLWNENPLRSTYPGSPHHSVDDVWCLFNDTAGGVVDDINVVPYRGWHELPIRDVVLNLMRRVNGIQLGRVVISRLAPGKSIDPHEDQGTPATYYQRYQIALHSLPGCVFKCGDEAVQMQTGDVWWFDNRLIHSVTNHSAEERIAMIVDIRQC
jgi:hypothetical protein